MYYQVFNVVQVSMINPKASMKLSIQPFSSQFYFRLRLGNEYKLHSSKTPLKQMYQCYRMRKSTISIADSTT